MSSNLEPTKRISCPIHGSVYLTSVEYEITRTRAFLRLQHVKQLGLGAYVYPGAEYSRFAHSIGVCHLAGRMLDVIERNNKSEFSPESRQITRLAALLHDVGHYPFSHATEEAVKNRIGDPLLESGASNDTSYFGNHEHLGRWIVENDAEITNILNKYKISPPALFDRLKGDDGERLSPLLSSDLDCDRLDYLKRTSVHAGLTYGGVDIDYLINSLSLDESGVPCLLPKAIGPADHFLLARSFDYAHLPFHKAVVGFEEALKSILIYLMEEGELDLSRAKIEEMMKTEAWYNFDDIQLMSQIRALEGRPLPRKIENALASLIRRSPPKVILSLEFIIPLSEKDDYESLSEYVKKASNEIAAEMGYTKDDIFDWSMMFEFFEESDSGLSIHIMSDIPGERSSRSIVQQSGTICGSIENQGRKYIRIYGYFRGSADPKAARDEFALKLRAKLKDSLPKSQLNPEIVSKASMALGGS